MDGSAPLSIAAAAAVEAVQTCGWSWGSFGWPRFLNLCSFEAGRWEEVAIAAGIMPLVEHADRLRPQPATLTRIAAHTHFGPET